MKGEEKKQTNGLFPFQGKRNNGWASPASKEKPGTPGELENEALWASKLIQGSANSPGGGGVGSAADLFRGCQNLLEHGRFPAAKPCCFGGVTHFGSLVCWAGMRNLLEVVVNLETGKERGASPSRDSPVGWGRAGVLAAPQPGVTFWSCVLFSQERSPCWLPGQG